MAEAYPDLKASQSFLDVQSELTDTEDKISDAMIGKLKAGLLVRGVFESQNAGGSGADFGRLKAGGVDVLEDGNCYILHHKVIVIDERTVITGSYNFTSSAEKDNDENLVIVDDPNLARAYLDEFGDVPSAEPLLPFEIGPEPDVEHALVDDRVHRRLL